jgi:hypothetical protein
MDALIGQEEAGGAGTGWRTRTSVFEWFSAVVSGRRQAAVLVVVALIAVSTMCWPRMELWRAKHLRPFHEGTMICSVETCSDGSLEYQRTYTIPVNNGFYQFMVLGAFDNEPFAYDIYEAGYTFAMDTGPDYSNEQNSFSYSADAPIWTASDPLQLYVKEGHPPTRVWTMPCSAWDSNKKRKNNTRCGSYFIIMRGDFYSSDFEEMMWTYVRSWPADGVSLEI